MAVQEAVGEQEVLFIRIARVRWGHCRLLIVDNGNRERGQRCAGIALSQPVVDALTAEPRRVMERHDDGEPAPVWWTPQIARKCGRSVSWPNASGGHSRRSSRRRPFGLSGRAVSQWASSRGNWI